MHLARIRKQLAYARLQNVQLGPHVHARLTLVRALDESDARADSKAF